MIYLNKRDLSNILKMLDMAEQHKDNGCGNRSVSKKAIIDMKNKINKIINQKETFTDNIETLKIDEYFNSILSENNYKNISENNYKKVKNDIDKKIKKLKARNKQLLDEINEAYAYRSKELPPISKEID